MGLIYFTLSPQNWFLHLNVFNSYCLSQGNMCPLQAVMATLPPQKWPARWPVLQTVWLIPGLPGHRAHTPVQPRMRWADRAAHAQYWHSQGKVIQQSFQFIQLFIIFSGFFSYIVFVAVVFLCWTSDIKFNSTVSQKKVLLSFIFSVQRASQVLLHIAKKKKKSSRINPP